MMGGFFRIAQKLFVGFSLLFVYFFCFPLTLLFLLIFSRKTLEENSHKHSFWQEAAGYDPDVRECSRQS